MTAGASRCVPVPGDRQSRRGAVALALALLAPTLVVAVAFLPSRSLTVELSDALRGGGIAVLGNEHISASPPGQDAGEREGSSGLQGTQHLFGVLESIDEADKDSGPLVLTRQFRQQTERPTTLHRLAQFRSGPKTTSFPRRLCGGLRLKSSESNARSRLRLL